MRCNEVVRAAAACLLFAIAATFNSRAALAQQSSLSVQGVAWSRPTQIISPVVMASWMTERSPDGVERLQLLVLWRGTPGWFLPDGPSGVAGTELAGHYHQTITEGDRQLTLDYDSSSRVATVHGKTIDVSRDNVVFVDEVDSPTGPRVTRTMTVERAMPGSAGQIGLVLRASPEIMSFLRCEATTTDLRKRAALERLCLESIGIRR